MPKVLIDGGNENFNGPVDELVSSGLLHRVLAGTETDTTITVKTTASYSDKTA